MKIGDHVLDARAELFTVLNAPDGSGVCDGLFQHDVPDGGQHYGEAMHHPLVVLP